MKVDRKLRLELAVQSGLFIVLLVVIAGLVAFAGKEYRVEWDVTHAARNSLAPATVEILRQLDGPLAITAYAVKHNANGVNVQKLVEERLDAYRREKPDIALALVDPRDRPKRAAEAGIRSANELVVSYRGRTEHLPVADFNEQNFANLLMRLARGAASLIVWLDGHGERKLDGMANHDLGDFGRALKARGFKVNSVNLALAQAVPANAALLVIAGPRVDLLPAEVGKIEDYVRGGGNLLWLVDVAPLHGLQPVAEALGLVLGPGTVVDFIVKPRDGPPVFAVGAPGNYARHPVTDGFRLNTLFPYAREIGAVESDTWRITPLIDVAPRGWVEVDALDNNVTFDKTRDVAGPVNIATAFERTIGDRQQRVIVFGTGNFLSNSYLGNGGNLELGLAAANWLTGADELVALEPRPAADSRLVLDQATLYLIAATFLVFLPVLFVLAGILVWWRRRRAA